MNSSVKFFEPTVRVTFPFAGSDLIRLLEALALPPAVELELLLPHAATRSAAAIATARASVARIVLLVADKALPFPLSKVSRRPADPVILRAAADALQPK